MNNSRKKLTLFLILFFCISHSIIANPITPRWMQVDQSGPARFHLKCTYDSQRETVVLFGGMDSLSRYFDDTWEWANGWTQYQVPGPVARIGHGMCYDATSHITLLFGGQDQNGEYLNDLWSWDGSAWTQIQAQAPSPRAFFVFAYDQWRQRAVLFGGIDSTGIIGDTWEWNGSTWTQRLIEGPPARILSAMAFNDIQNVLVLFGGEQSIDEDFLNDTWILDANGWREVNCQDRPPARVGHAMAYDNELFESMILFGGHHDEIYPPYDDTWIFDGSNWFSIDYIYWKPSPRTCFDMCLKPSDYNRSTVFLIGGYDNFRVFGEIWTFPVLRNYIFGDINNDSAFNGLDLIYGVNYFKGFGPVPPYSMMCGFSVWYVAGDVNGSCSYNGLDITYAVSYFKGGPAVNPCPICPQ